MCVCMCVLCVFVVRVTIYGQKTRILSSRDHHGNIVAIEKDLVQFGHPPAFRCVLTVGRGGGGRGRGRGIKRKENER